MEVRVFLELRTLPSSTPVPHLKGEGVPLGGLAHQPLLFALLEFPEVFLDQEGGVKLANCDLIIWDRCREKGEVRSRIGPPRCLFMFSQYLLERW